MVQFFGKFKSKETLYYDEKNHRIRYIADFAKPIIKARQTIFIFYDYEKDCVFFVNKKGEIVLWGMKFRYISEEMDLIYSDKLTLGAKRQIKVYKETERLLKSYDY